MQINLMTNISEIESIQYFYYGSELRIFVLDLFLCQLVKLFNC